MKEYDALPADFLLSIVGSPTRVSAGLRLATHNTPIEIGEDFHL